MSDLNVVFAAYGLVALALAWMATSDYLHKLPSGPQTLGELAVWCMMFSLWPVVLVIVIGKHVPDLWRKE